MTADSHPAKATAEPASDQHPLLVLVGSQKPPPEAFAPTLLVDAQAERLQSLRLQVGSAEEERGCLFQQAVLAAHPMEEVPWYHFNDSRLDGVVSLDTWRTFYPNLQLLGQESFTSLTLSDLLEDWPAAQDGQRAIHLTLTQGHPVKVLTGAGSWLHRLQRVQLQGPRAAELWRETLSPWLEDHGFRVTPEDPLCWTLDPLAAKVLQYQDEIESLRNLYALKQRKQEIHGEQLLAALQHLFPHDIYRALRPDIAEFNNQDLVDHFVTHGINEGIDLRPKVLLNELQELRERKAQEEARFELLKAQSLATSQHLAMLRELVSQELLDP